MAATMAGTYYSMGPGSDASAAARAICFRAVIELPAICPSSGVNGVRGCIFPELSSKWWAVMRPRGPGGIGMCSPLGPWARSGLGLGFLREQQPPMVSYGKATVSYGW